MGVECSVASHFGLGGGHALEVKRMNRMRNVLFHDSKHRLLTLQRPNAIEGFGDDSDMEMVARSVQVNNLNHGFRNGLAHFRFDPFTAHHLDASLCPAGFRF
jgi:hypothetical protein